MTNRRECITLLGGIAAWPLMAQAQQQERVRRIGVLTYWGPNNRVAMAGIAAFKSALQQSGWSEGVNTRIEMRWCENSVERARGYAAELVALTPDVILAANTPSVVALQSITRTLPIVFVSVSDPE